jgi:hypothetical protein
VAEITGTDIAAWLSFTPSGAPETELLDRVASAVEQLAAKLYTIPVDATRTELQFQALVMQGGRIWQRRKSPDGFAGGDERGVIRVSRFDPDVVAMLVDDLDIGFGGEPETETT